MSDELSDKLREIDTEDIIWLIYIGIIFLSWYANSLEREYFINNDYISRNKYRKIMITIFTILLIIYLYFLYSSYESLNKLKWDDSNEKKQLSYLSFLGSLLLLASGVIFWYIAIMDNQINVEISFN